MESILDAIGCTPLLVIEGIHVKCEYLNPSGSIKDRIARYMIERAEKRGLLVKGDTIVEASTGNMGTSLAMVGAERGYRVIVYIAQGLSRERYAMIKAFGGELRLVPEGRMDLARAQAIELGKQPGHYHPDQFANPWNPEEYERIAGPEILEQLGGRHVDAVVTGIGTGGTLLGLARAFRKCSPRLRVYGVEPLQCALVYDHIHKQPAVCKPHHIDGIGDGFIPPLIYDNLNLIDDVVRIDSNSAIAEAKRLAREYACFVGVCSGANVLAAKQIKAKLGLDTVVTVFTDEGEKYLSEEWFASA